jgi:FkbM family methyltransferase
MMKGLSPAASLVRGAWLTPAKKVYFSVINALAGGKSVNLGNGRRLRMPAEFSGASEWERYEQKTVDRFASVVGSCPAIKVIDAGCSIGIYSLLALAVSRECEVFAIDSDLTSLAMTKAMCRKAGAQRLHTIRGFCGDAQMSASNPIRASLRQAIETTDEALRNFEGSIDKGANRYICIGDSGSDGIPSWDLDSLFGDLAGRGEHLLLKCDVEGAEKFVLAGCEKILASPNIQLLLSLHREPLLRMGTSPEALTGQLRSKGFSMELVDIDTEEHWWGRKV